MIKTYEEINELYNLSGNQWAAALDRGVRIGNIEIRPTKLPGIKQIMFEVKEVA